MNSQLWYVQGRGGWALNESTHGYHRSKLVLEFQEEISTVTHSEHEFHRVYGQI